MPMHLSISECLHVPLYQCDHVCSAVLTIAVTRSHAAKRIRCGFIANNEIFIGQYSLNNEL